MFTLICYANQNFARAAKLQQSSFILAGGQNARIYSENHIDPDYISRHKETFELKRGAGYWLWKPWIILDALKSLPRGGSVLYLDAGILLSTPIDILQNAFDSQKITLWSGEPEHTLSQWTHPNVVSQLRLANDLLSKNLILAGALHVPNNSMNRQLILQWKQLCEQPRLLRPETLESHLANYPVDYVWHRHDSTLITIVAHSQPENFNVLDFQQFQTLFDVHRNPNPWYVLISGRNQLILKIRKKIVKSLPKKFKSFLVWIKFRTIAKRKGLSPNEILNHSKFFKS